MKISGYYKSLGHNTELILNYNSINIIFLNEQQTYYDKIFITGRGYNGYKKDFKAGFTAGQKTLSPEVREVLRQSLTILTSFKCFNNDDWTGTSLFQTRLREAYVEVLKINIEKLLEADQ
jgi:hypothetical protein